MVRNVKVITANATALLVSWDALQVSYLSHYTIYYSAFSPLLSKVVDTLTKVIPSTNTSGIVNIRELTAGVEHQFQVTASLEIEEEVYEKMIFMPATFLFGKYYKYDAGLLTCMPVTLSLCTVYEMTSDYVILQLMQCFSFKWDL